MKFGDHITWGTYGTRLHGDPRGTVDREHNERGAPVLGFDEGRWEREKGNLEFPPVELTHEQRIFIEETIPIICVRGHWEHITSAARLDHVHTVLKSPFNPETVRTLLKRWLGQEMAKYWPRQPGQTFWAECGSIRPILNQPYLINATDYVDKQRTSGPRA
jgi:hypothetical protein